MSKSTPSLKKCEWCGGEMAERVRRNARFCTRRCHGTWYSKFGAARPSAEKSRAYTDAYRKRKRAAELATRPIRRCEECDDELPRESRPTKRFCSRRCTNQVSLREASAARRATLQLRRARIRAANSPGVSARDWARLVARYDGRCAYCDIRGRMTMDHVVPVSRGGWHAIGNILPACFPCNASKRDDLLIYWLHGRASARLKVAA